MNIKRAWMVFLGTLVLTVPARICQLLFCVDYETGFFTDHGILAGLLIGVLILCSAIIIFMCHMDKNAPKRYPPVKNIPLGVFSGAAGVAVIVHSVLEIVHAGKPRYTDLSDSAAQAASQFSAPQMYMTIILSFVGVISGIVWLVTASGYFKGKNIFRGYPVFSLIPSIWFCLSLVLQIIGSTSYTSATENISDMLTIMFLLLFTFMQAKMSAGVQFRRSGKEIYAFGLPAILFVAITSAPNIILQIAGVSPLSSFPLTLSIVYCILAGYAVLYLVVVRRIPEVSIPEPVEEEPGESALEENASAEEAAQAAEAEPGAGREPETEEIEEESPSSAETTAAAAEAPVRKRKWNEPVEELVEEEIIELSSIPSIYKYKKPPKPKRKKRDARGRKIKRKRRFTLENFMRLIRRFLGMPKTPEEEAEEEAERKAAWRPGQLDEPASKKLDNDWIMDYYGIDRGDDDQPYIPKVYDLDGSSGEAAAGKTESVVTEKQAAETGESQESGEDSK